MHLFTKHMAKVKLDQNVNNGSDVITLAQHEAQYVPGITKNVSGMTQMDARDVFYDGNCYQKTIEQYALDVLLIINFIC